jgi:hypothetical protein
MLLGEGRAGVAVSPPPPPEARAKTQALVVGGGGFSGNSERGQRRAQLANQNRLVVIPV